MYPRPSFIAGYAANSCESLYPELWAGLIGLWAPGLGCQTFNNSNATIAGAGGVQLRDMSGYRRTAFADGGPENRFSVFGGPALESLDTAFAGLRIDDDTSRMMEVTDGFTFVFHHQKTDATQRTHYAFAFGTGTSLVRAILPNNSDSTIYWDYGGSSGSNRLTVAVPTMGDDVWVFRAGRSGLSIWQNGQVIAQSTTPVTRTSGSGTVSMKGNSTNCDLCRCEFLYLYNRELSDKEIQTVSNVRLAPLYLRRPSILALGGGAADLEHSVSQTLTLSSEAVGNIEKLVSASSTLNLADSLIAGTVEEVSHELTFNDVADYLHFIADIHHISHQLNLTDSAEGDNADIEETTHSLNLAQSVSVQGPVYISVHDYLNLGHSVSGALGVPWLPIQVVDTLTLTQVAGRVWPRSVASMLALSQAAYRSYVVIDTLTLTETIEYGKGPDESEQSLNLAQTVLLNAIYRRSVTHDNIVSDSVTYYEDSPCARKRYTPFEGGEASMPELRPHFRSQFMLETLSGPYLAITLRNPELDDRDRLSFNRVNRETSGGELNIFCDPVWSKVNTLLFTVVALKRDKIDALRDFLLESLGQEIKLSDWSGSQWRGVVTSPNEVASEDSDGYWTFSFEFEGEPYEGQAPGDRLAITQAATAFIESPP